MLCEWIKAAQAGDKESINKLIEKFQPLLRKRKIASTLTFLGGCFAATNI